MYQYMHVNTFSEELKFSQNVCVWSFAPMRSIASALLSHAIYLNFYRPGSWSTLYTWGQQDRLCGLQIHDREAGL